MSAVQQHVAAALAVLRRDLLIYFSYRLRLAVQLLGAFFSLTLFYYLSRLVNVAFFPTPDAYFAYAVIGLVILSVLNSTLGSPPTMVRQELVAGTFERLYLSPFGPVGSLLSMLLFPFCFALVNGLAMLLFAGVVFGLHVEWDTAWLAIPLGMLGALSFLPFGVAMLAVVIVVKQAVQGTTWIIAGISLIAGLYFPVSLLPDWTEWMSHIQPFTPATELLRNVLVGTPMLDPAWLNLVKLVGFSAALLPMSIWLVQRALAVGRRRGTIIEY